jgi:hypothetical protein
MKKFLLLLALLMIIPLTLADDDDDDRKSSSFENSYYLTPNEAFGDEVLDQCARKFHFATIWEIRDTSNLTYDVSRGLTTDESGYGPPTGFLGWIGSGSGGQPSCDNWTSSANGEQFPELGRIGTVGILDPTELFNVPPDFGGDGWELRHHPCWHSAHVWCVSNRSSRKSRR